MNAITLPFDEAAKCMAELGHPHRLQIFQLLIKTGVEGLPVGAIQNVLQIPKSTLAHHMAQLVSVDLVTQTREGRIQRCRVNTSRAEALLRFFVAECCDGLTDLAELQRLIS